MRFNLARGHAATHRAGSVQIMAISLISVTALFFGGMITLMRTWRIEVDTQKKMDDCIQAKTMEMQRTLNRLKNSSRRMSGFKTSAGLATLAPPLRAALQTAIHAEWMYQETLLASWKFNQTRWILRSGCDSIRGVRTLPLPSIAVRREAPDSSGPGILIWDQPQPDSLFWMSDRSRQSGSILRAESHPFFSSAPIGPTWKAQWASLPLEIGH